MMFAIDRGLQWRMGFANPSWNLEKGRSFNVAYVIDRNPPNIASVRAVDKTIAIAELQANAAVFQQFRLGRLLTVQAERDTFRFSLDGTAHALSALLDCAKANTAVAHAPPPAQAAPPHAAAPVPAVDVVSAEEKLDATRLVANMLAGGQLREFKMMTSAEMSDPTMPSFIRSADVAWKAPGTIGTLNVIRNAKRMTLDEMAAITMGTDAASCKGRFVSGKIPDAELPAIRREFTSCRDGEQTLYLEYIFVPRPDGSALRFSTISTGPVAAEKAQEPDNRLRNAVQEVVFRN